MSEGDENGINTIKIHKYKSLPSRLGKSYIFDDPHQTFNFMSRFLLQGNSRISGLHHALASCFFVPCVFAGPQTLSRVDAGVKDINQFQPHNESASLNISSITFLMLQGSLMVLRDFKSPMDCQWEPSTCVPFCKGLLNDSDLSDRSEV